MIPFNYLVFQLIIYYSDKLKILACLHNFIEELLKDHLCNPMYIIFILKFITLFVLYNVY